MLILRLKQAECALADGRLDEACDLLSDASLRSHARGQRLITRLVHVLVERARKHLAAGRLPQAQADGDRALALGGNHADVAELRAAVNRALETVARKDRQQALLLAAAKEQIDAGRMDLGRQWLAEMSNPGSRAAVLMRDIEIKQTTFETALKAAQTALDRNDLAQAARQVLVARAADGQDERLIELTASLGDQIKSALTDALESGRLDLAETLTEQLASVCGETADVLQFRSAIEQCRQAWAHLDCGDPARAVEALKRIAIRFPTAKWIESALKYMHDAQVALAELRGGPLALLGIERDSDLRHAPPSEAIKTQQQIPEAGSIEPLPSQFLLRVDGAGSFVVFRTPVVRIGPISSSHRPDLGLLAEPGVPIATIHRQEDEYFIRGEAVAVNDRPGNGKLLASRDRIALSPRCRMHFNLPSAASTTAVLDLTGARYPRADVRRVILLDRDIILGAGLASHVRVEGAKENCILHVRDGRFFCESKLPVEVNGAPMDRLSGIPMEAHVKVGSMSFVVSRD